MMCTTALIILLVCNSFIAGVFWEENSCEPPKLRVYLTLFYLVFGTTVQVLYGTFRAIRKPLIWVEARTNLWFFTSWPFRKKKYLRMESEYLDFIENHYAENKKRFGIFNWLNAQAAKKILLLNNRKLP